MFGGRLLCSFLFELPNAPEDVLGRLFKIPRSKSWFLLSVLYGSLSLVPWIRLKSAFSCVVIQGCGDILIYIFDCCDEFCTFTTHPCHHTACKGTSFACCEPEYSGVDTLVFIDQGCPLQVYDARFSEFFFRYENWSFEFALRL